MAEPDITETRCGSCCRTPYGLCARKHNCDCHRRALRQDKIRRDEAAAAARLRAAKATLG